MTNRKKLPVKEEIKKALLRMLRKKSYTDITVTDLINTAQVARISFYRNFKSIDDVIDSIADNIVENLNVGFVPVFKANDECKWREFLFEILYRIKEMREKTGIPFRESADRNFNSRIILARVQEKLKHIEQELPERTPDEKYRMIGKMHFIFGIISKWALSGTEETPEEIVNIIVPIILKF